MVSFTRDSGSRSGINVVRGEKQRFAKATAARSTPRTRSGLRRNTSGAREDRDPPVIVVRRASAAPTRPRVEGLLPFDRLDPAAGASFATLAMLDSDALALAPRELLGAGVVASDGSPMYDLWFDLPEDIEAQEPDYPVVPSLESSPQAIDETFLAIAGPTSASVPASQPAVAGQGAPLVVAPPAPAQIEGGSLRRMRGQ